MQLSTPSFSRLKKMDSAGFTMVEILIVVLIIGVLAGIGIASFTASQQKARDSRRKADLNSITKALEVYYNDKGDYPAEDSGKIAGCANGTACDWGDTWADENGTVYMVKLPEDPASGFFYTYDSTPQGGYQLYARLENTLDKDVPKDGASNPLQYSGYTCTSSSACNYGIASTNSTLPTPN